MNKWKKEISVVWVHGTPFAARFYYLWQSKRTPIIVYDAQDGAYTKKDPTWRGRTKERWQRYGRK